MARPSFRRSRRRDQILRALARGVAAAAASGVVFAGTITLASRAPLDTPRQPAAVPTRRTGHAGATRATPAAAGEVRVRVTSMNSTPLHRAVVTAEGETQAAGATSQTDTAGWATLQLPPGRWVIAAVRDGYLAMRSGQRAPHDLPRPIIVGASQRVSFTLQLPRCGVLGGRVMDELGEPAPRITVRALRLTERDGVRRQVVAGQAESNEAGLYSIAGLTPATYVIAATMSLEIARPETPGEAVAFAPTYYPGTAGPNDAQPIALGLEQEAPGFDFMLIPTRLARVAGRVVDARGRAAAGASIVLTAPLDASDPDAWYAVASGQSSATGQFALGPVPHGTYVLRATLPHDAGVTNEVARLPLPVSGDVTDVTLAGRMAGGMIFEVRSSEGALPWRSSSAGGGADQTRGALDASQFRVRAVPLGDAAPGSEDLTARPVTRPAPFATGSFGIGALWGRYRILVERLPDGWWLDAVRSRNQDVTDEPIEITASSTAMLSVVLTSEPTEIRGTARGQGRAAPDYVVLVFPADRTRWKIPRCLRAARPDQNGEFSIKGLPPGSYHAAALDAVVREDWANPELLERLRSLATAVTLERGTPHTVSLALISP